MTTRLRLGSVGLIFLVIVFFPYWVYLPVLGAGIIFFPFFWEAIFLGFLIDVLYGGGVSSASHLFSPMAFAAAVFLAVMLPVRDRIRVYA